MTLNRRKSGFKRRQTLVTDVFQQPPNESRVSFYDSRLVSTLYYPHIPPEDAILFQNRQPDNPYLVKFFSSPAVQTSKVRLKAELKSKLSYAGIHGGTSNDTEGGRREVGVRIRELRMIQGIEKFGAKFETASFSRPRKRYQF